MNKKILFITHQLSRTGAPQVLLNMIMSCVSDGHSVAIISLSDGEARSDWEQLGLNISVLPQLQFIQDDIIPILNKFDIIVLNTLLCYKVAKVCGKTNVKTIWWIHEYEAYFTYYEKELPSPAEISNNIHILAVSPVTQSLIKNKWGISNSQILPLGVDDFSDKIYKNKVNRDHPVFLCIGLFSITKGQDTLCQAIDMLPESMNKCLFKFYGDFTQVDSTIYEYLKYTCSTNPNVTINDSVNHTEMLQIIAESDYLVIPSRHEAMPTVAVEAMMLGIPCILSEACGISEYMKNQDSCLFFEPNNISDLSRVLCESVSIFNTSTYSSISKSGRELYEKYFSMDVFKKNVSKLLL